MVRPSGSGPAGDAGVHVVGTGTRAGRPRDPTRDAALLDAAVAVLDEVGFDALTVDAVARRAGAGKATVYRRWPSKELLVFEALLRAVSAEVPLPETGDLVRDLAGVLRDGTRTLAAHRERVAALVAAAVTRPELARQFDEVFLEGRRRAIRTLYRRAVLRGDLEDGPGLELLLEAPSALLLHRAVLRPGMPLDGAFVDELLKILVVPALRRAGLREVGEGDPPR